MAREKLWTENVRINIFQPEKKIIRSFKIFQIPRPLDVVRSYGDGKLCADSTESREKERVKKPQNDEKLNLH